MNMKKNISVLLAAMAALLVASCSRESIPQTERPFTDGETGLVLKVRSTAPQTRLIHAPADDALNEFRLEQYYYFLFAVDPSLDANASAVPVFMGKWTAPEGEPTIGTGTETITLDKLTALASADGNTYSGFAYVIANYKGSGLDADEDGVDDTLAAWDALIASNNPDYSDLNWAYFQSLPLPATFQTYNDISSDSSLWPAEQMNSKADEGHRFKAQDSFVMASTPTQFTVQKGEPGEIDAPLFRLASKIGLEIHLAQTYIQKDNGHFKYTWKSDPSRVQVYLCYAADKGTMDGTPITYIANGDNANTKDFFTYRRFAFLSNWTKDGDDYVFPDGSYTSQEPYKWVYKDGADPAAQPETVDGQTIYYTADEDLKNQLVLDSDGKPVTHDVTHASFKITGTPFYSYPYDFSGDSGHAPYFKVIVEWTAYDASNTPQIISQEFFYKISIPGITVFEPNKYYGLRLNLSTLGSEVDEASIDVSSDTYFVADWSDPTNPDVPDLTAGRYLSVSSLKQDEDGNPLFEMYSTKIEIPVVSSHPFSVVTTGTDAPTGTFNNYTNINVSTGSLVYNATTSTGNNYTFTETDNSVTLLHTYISNINNVQSKDLSPITYHFTVKQDEGSLAQPITVIQYPPLHIVAQLNYNYTLGTSNSARDSDRGFVYVNNQQNTNTRNWDYTGGLYPGGNVGSANPNMYIINTSVMDPSLGYSIGDPRVEAINNLGYTFADAPAIEGGRRTLMYYYPTDETSATANIVAPSFRIVSSYGRFGDSKSKDLARRRCAAFQEDGHPAGRWRLPTQAELEYITTLSSKNLIPTLFNVGGSYWSAQGLVTVNNNGTVTPSTGNSGFARCVYDEWYWGSETVDRTVFTWGDMPR